ncbi:hypothetical protein [Pseudoxanthomonas winnipegensis]|uniref:Uncharacterized protein n=1 Tax=Pseudoxanthomonas winnipegensis TaxID=2480810 RepID=A0A4Q8LK48_9GAMM|nr:hypothetical protein [Pseudoxanthomonas winnipegensis]RZZ87859.1 hypothetical protein EA662_08260 [Pseudoxanthomonas winnipegensis]TAA29996.1 hypothetical protein EA661_10850 [Pseudoxanthomonas winnipegensis]TAA36932.1 hypothetical protein EAT51_18530 [Pseudoxanthomonas winnipegensis]TBV78138.1 hypothetical protein EYC46_04080 [Pseudoxanthomonas winnipegensis]
MSAVFEVSKRIDLTTTDVPGTHGLIRTLSPSSITQVKKSIDSGYCGVYVFSLLGGGGNPVPWYVGLAKKQPLGIESMEKDKLRKYAAAMFGRRGSPSITFLCPIGNASIKGIDGLETLLIWIARAKNPNLLNERKVSGKPGSIISLTNSILVKGVINRGQGKPSNVALDFIGMMGL